MESSLIIQGKQIGAGEITTICELISRHPSWHRTRLSQELCREWNWCNEAGQLKDIAARTLLRKLDHRGLIQLPAPIRSANNKFRNRPDRQMALDLEAEQILPGIRIPHLASHLLALINRRISADWLEKYGHPILLLETFVEQQRFAGTCYKAANWVCVGQTTGRSRNHSSGAPTVPVKSVWLYPLHRAFRGRLIAQEGHCS